MELWRRVNWEKKDWEESTYREIYKRLKGFSEEKHTVLGQHGEIIP